MTTAQIIAIIFVFIAVSDVLLGFLWLFPKLGGGVKPETYALLDPEEKREQQQKERAIRIIKLAVWAWAIIALAIAYYLWNNPDII